MLSRLIAGAVVVAAAFAGAPTDPAHAAWSLVQGRAAADSSLFVRAAVRMDRTRIDRLDIKYRATCRRGGKTRRWSTVADYTKIRVRDGRFSLRDRFRHPQTGDVDDNRVRGTIGADGTMRGSYAFYSNFYGRVCRTGWQRFTARRWLPSTQTARAADGTAVTLELGPASGETSRPTATAWLSFAAPLPMHCDDGTTTPLTVSRWPATVDVNGFTTGKTSLARVGLRAPSDGATELTDSATLSRGRYGTPWPSAITGSLEVSRWFDLVECSTGRVTYGSS